jgi:hypothetical protein
VPWFVRSARDATFLLSSTWEPAAAGDTQALSAFTAVVDVLLAVATDPVSAHISPLDIASCLAALKPASTSGVATAFDSALDATAAAGAALHRETLSRALRSAVMMPLSALQLPGASEPSILTVARAQSDLVG